MFPSLDPSESMLRITASGSDALNIMRIDKIRMIPENMWFKIRQ